jgi:uncharacterized protein YdaU (DUF1376 family)
MGGIGHNSGTFGQILKPAAPSQETPQKKPKGRFPFFKFYPRDWLEATRDLSLEARGAYIDLICILMEMEGHLADNDKWISHQMHVSPRKWRTLKVQLVEHEKIFIDDGKIVNERCLKELDALLNQQRNLSDSATKRERDKRETSAKHPRNIRETSVKHPGNIDENFEQPNENHDASTTVVALRARVLDLDSDLEEEKEKKRGDAHARAPAPQDGFAKVASAFAAGLAATIAPIGLAAAPVEQTVQFMQDVAECWQTSKARYDAGVSIHEKRAQHQIWMTPLGVLEVAGDFKAELEREFPLVDLKAGLSVAAPNVRIGEGAIRATQAIRRAFAYRQDDAAGKQKRAESWQKTNGQAADPADPAAKYRKFYDGVL